MTPNIHLAALHFPVYNKSGEIVVSSITTLDVHDISRICRTYGLGSLYFVTPLKSQHKLVEDIMRHWRDGRGAVYNPTRKEALKHTCVKNLLPEVIQDIETRFGSVPKCVVTDAKKFDRGVGYGEMRQIMESGGQYLLIFGTGWGLEKSIVESADYILDPIEGADGFNHLPVRAAVAVILDRLLGNFAG